MVWRIGVAAVAASLVALFWFLFIERAPSGQPATADRRTGAAVPVQRLECRDEQGRRYSEGALTRFGSEVRRCSSGSWQPPAPTASPVVSAPRSTGCKDEQGRSYSPNALVRIGGSIKKCTAGRWDDVPERTSQTPGREHERASAGSARSPAPVQCKDEAGRLFSRGALARIQGVVKKCQDGKWIPASDR